MSLKSAFISEFWFFGPYHYEVAVLCVLLLTFCQRLFMLMTLEAQFEPLDTWLVSKQTQQMALLLLSSEGGACLTCAESNSQHSFSPEQSLPLSLQLKPNTCDIMDVDIGCWMAGPAYRAAGCSLHFIPRSAQQLWPALPATRIWSVFRSITLLQSCGATTCGWPQRLHASPRHSAPMVWRGIVLWALRNCSVTSEEQHWRLPALILRYCCFLHGAWHR